MPALGSAILPTHTPAWLGQLHGPGHPLHCPLAPQIPHQPYNHPQLLCNLSPTHRKQEVGAESRGHFIPALIGPPPVPQFPLSQYLTWPVLPKCCGPFGTPGPASLSCPCPGTTCAGPLGGRPGRVSEPPGCELPATWRRSPGIGRPGRTPGQLWSPGVCFLPSLPTLLCVCVFPSFLTEGILPSWLPAPRVVTPGPTLEWQPQPRPLPACDFIPSLSCFCTLGLLEM